MIDAAELVLWPIVVVLPQLALLLSPSGKKAWTALQRWQLLFLLALVGAVLVALFAALMDPTASDGAVFGGAFGLAALVGLVAYERRLTLLTEAQAALGPDPKPVVPSTVPFRTWLLVFGGFDALFLALCGALTLGLSPSVLASGTTGAAQAVANVLTAGELVVVLAEAVMLVGLLRAKEAGRGVQGMFVLQSLVLLFTPTAFGVSWWSGVAIYLESAVLVALFVYLMQYMYRNKQLHVPVASYMVRLVGASFLTCVGLCVWILFGNDLLLAGAMGVQALVFGLAVWDLGTLDDEARLSWPMKPFWAFQMLLFIFLSELFMGALLDIQIYGLANFFVDTPFVPLTGSAPMVGLSAVYDALWFIASVCVSAWFLILVGAEMGSLVVFKIRETREREQKLRLGLMMAVYAVAVVYIPSMWSSTPLLNDPALANIPIVGWGMGIRTGGPFETSFFAAIILMYVSVGALTLLFGRRALCSVMCGAALMYQGTAMSAMSSFNRSSRIGKLFLGSNFSAAYSATSGIALASLFATSFLPYLNLPGLHFSGQGVVTAYFLPFELYFGALWFIMFVSIPYVGNYNCVTTGFCHWGSFSQIFSRFGFFKLKVKSKEVCQTCTTEDCAKSCPIGLVDMPEHFRKKGEFRSAKCCGVGDCVGACPHNNMMMLDVRDYFRKFTGQGPRVPPAKAHLPMAGAKRPLTPTPSAAPAEAAPAGASS